MLIVAVLGMLVGVALFRVLRFASTPLLRSVGFYRYYSPMFFTMPLGKNVLDMHVGTAWDFARLRERSASTIIRHVADGLAELCAAAQRGEVSMHTRLRGTMYFLSASTLERFGFRARALRWYEMLAFVANYIEVCMLQSILRRRLCWVNLRNVRIVEATMYEVLECSHSIEGVRGTLLHRSTSPTVTYRSLPNS